MNLDARRYADATQRNRQPILEILQRILPPEGNILEISSGTGQHAVFFAAELVNHDWYPSDPDPLSRDSIAAWRNHHPSDNLHDPLDIDAMTSCWAIENEKISIDAITQCQAFCLIANINMIHISPWKACLGLMAGANRLLSAGGILYLYGPYKRNGQHISPSNEMFDRSLRSRNFQWGVRNLEDVVAIAESEDLELQEVVAMPANNLSVIFRKQ
ncbi:Protein of unknown function (DUF938) [Xenococcus sp. PCC 7305]|uniref:DUF938 domain-containing protein n=1 Tax=Xenococcus sp. PCC 7305 TaxID=102125 RepID=UPI0002ACDC5F|nr:DUF938 domain-containing protein [Xenococcus sp. PCC 7305]ELS01462.1 Protein of unknown function (DUF938) [Xenococcus sp. PCC 7305]